jgi:hypothetical protein
VAYILQENGMPTVGDLLIQMKVSEDDILKLQGIGPRAMTEIHRLVDMYSVAAAETEAEAPAEAETAIPGGFETVKVSPEVEEVTKRAVEEPAVAEEVEITSPTPVQAPEGVPEAGVPEAGEAEAVAPEAGVPEAVAPEAGVPEGAEAVAPEGAEGVAETEEGEEGEEVTFDELFTLRPEVAETGEETEEDDASGKPGAKKKGKKKGKKHTEVEFDPDAGMTIVHKKHKRGGEEWEW